MLTRKLKGRNTPARRGGPHHTRQTIVSRRGQDLVLPCDPLATVEVTVAGSVRMGERDDGGKTAGERGGGARPSAWALYPRRLGKARVVGK